MLESKLKIIAPPDFLMRIGVPTADADRLVADGDATAAPDLAKSADCTQWTQVTLVCDCGGGGGASFDFDLWWHYRKSNKWVKDGNVQAKRVLGSANSAFIVSTGAADAMYAQVTATAGGGIANIWVEADK